MATTIGPGKKNKHALRILGVKYGTPFFILVAAVMASGAIVTRAQTATSTPSDTVHAGTQGITFPIPELGNCASKDACRAYCNDPVNMTACIAFAKAHGLMNSDEATRAEKFRQNLATDGGPGGCKTPDDCKAFCSDTANLEVCVQFAKDQGLKDQNSDQGAKILAYIKSGGVMPGGCTSQESCKAYCSDFTHAQECFQFAQKAGITQAPGNGGGGNSEQNPAQLQKFLDLAKNGQTPGGCTSKEACEAYCKDSSHHDECVAFAVKAGFITQAQADQEKQSGGKGPGGCDSRDTCEAYCNNDAHRDECLKFAEDRGVLNHDQVTQTKQGLTSLRTGLEQAPPAVADCLNSTVGSSTLDSIQSGTLTPGQDVIGAIKSCFQKFGGQNDPAKIFKNAPPQVTSCLKDKLGSDFNKITSGQESTTPEMADAFRICYQNVQLQGGSTGPQGNKGEGGRGGPSSDMVKHFLMTAPPEIQTCLKDKLGADFDAIVSGTQGVQIDTSKLKDCFQQFRPQMPTMPGEMMQGSASGSAVVQYRETDFNFFQKLPPQVLDCVKGKLGGDFLKLQSGAEKLAPETDQLMKGCFTGTQPGQGMGMPNPTTPLRGLFPNGPLGGQPIPPQYAQCINSVLGDGGMVKLQSGQVTADQKAQISNCVSSQGGTGKGDGQVPNKPDMMKPPFDGQTSPPPPSGDIQPPPPPLSPSSPSTNLGPKSFLGSIASTFDDFLKSLFQ